MNDETVKVVAHLDLTGKTRSRPHIESEIQHVFFHRLRPANALRPGVVDIDMTGSAGAGTATFRVDARDGVAHGILHHGGTVAHVEFMGRAVKGNDCQFCHAEIQNVI